MIIHHPFLHTMKLAHKKWSASPKTPLTSYMTPSRSII
jgi:hypothetical protein